MRRGAGGEQKGRDADDRDDEDDFEDVARGIREDRQLASGAGATKPRFAEAGHERTRARGETCLAEALEPGHEELPRLEARLGHLLADS